MRVTVVSAPLLVLTLAANAFADQPGASAPSPPISISGPMLLPTALQSPAPSSVGAGAGGNAALEARVRALETELAKQKADGGAEAEWLKWASHLKFSGYVQPLYQFVNFNDDASPNLDATTHALPAGIGANAAIPTAKLTPGTTTNQTMFRMRRARLKTEYMPSEYSRMVLEIEPFASGSQPIVARQTEAQGIAKWTSDWETEFAAGIFKVPFSFEILQSDADRPFVERSNAEQGMFPAEFDTGARATTRGLSKHFVANVAVINGQTIGEKTFSAQWDLNHTKDVVARVNYDLGPADIGVGGYFGKGQTVDSTALKMKEFNRWAGHVELGLHHTLVPSLGATNALVDVVFGSNMHRSSKYGFASPAIPATFADDVENQTQFAYLVLVSQDITPWATVALRYDSYAPNTNVDSSTVSTIAASAIAHLTKGLQLHLEFDNTSDSVHAKGKPSPSGQVNAIYSMLQARF